MVQKKNISGHRRATERVRSSNGVTSLHRYNNLKLSLYFPNPEIKKDLLWLFLHIRQLSFTVSKQTATRSRRSSAKGQNKRR